MEQQLLKSSLEIKEKSLIIEQLKRRLDDQERRFQSEIASLKAQIKGKPQPKSPVKERLILDQNDTFTADTKDRNDYNQSIHSDKQAAMGSPRFDEFRHYSFKASKVFADKLETKSQSPFGRNAQYANELLSVMDGSSISFNKDSNYETIQKELKNSETVG